MITNRKVRLTAILILTILTFGVSFTFDSIYGSTNVSTGIAEQQYLVKNHHFNEDTNSASSSDTSSSQISPYSGQEIRDIKSLADSDIQSLRNGTGEAFGGMAKPAELNGYPGPRHVLDMASNLQLTDRQNIEIELIYQDMSSKAKSIGGAIIAIEEDMNSAFDNRTMTQGNLKLMLDKNADLYGQLRFVHLSAHLDTVQALTIEQVQMYNKIRGYNSGSTGNSSFNNEDSSSQHQHLIR
jgi:hypothetical protein